MEQIKNIIIDRRFPEMLQNLLNRLWCKQKPFLTLDKFLTECAYWVLRNEMFSELKPKSYPLKLFEVIEYYKIPVETRRRLEKKYYDDNPKIMEWFILKRYIEKQNKANLLWLQEIYNYIPKEDTITRDKIKNRIFDFEDFENQAG